MPRPARVEVKQFAPPVLEVAQFIKLVDKVRKSRKKADSDAAFNQLAHALKPRIRSLCSKFDIKGMTQDDIYQEALIALKFKAIKDYDQTRGSGEGPAPFDRFALLCIRRHLATELKASHQIRRRVINGAISLDQERNEFNDDLSLINIIPHTKGDVLNIIAHKEYFRRLIGKLLSKLSKFEHEVFKLYIEKYTYEEISVIINRRKLRNGSNIKSIDNALSRIKHKAHAIFYKLNEQQEKSEMNNVAPQPREGDGVAEQE
jgi:RNA polymerase sigma-H factor